MWVKSISRRRAINFILGHDAAQYFQSLLRFLGFTVPLVMLHLTY